MKSKNWNKFTTLLILIFCNSITWANDLPPSFGSGEPEDPDVPASPIDMWVYPAIVVGMYIAYRFYIKSKKVESR